MFNLIVFLLKWLFVGKPKEEQHYFSFTLDTKEEFDKKMKELLKNNKWSIQKVEVIPLSQKDFSCIIYCKQKYH